MTLALRIALAGGAGLLISYVAWAFSAPPSTWRAEREVVARMTQGERAQLRRRYKEYQRMSPAERGAVLELHKAVQEDDQLAKTLSRYTHFVAGLAPWEREDLQAIGPSGERIAAMRPLLSEDHDRDGDMRRPGWMTGEMVRGPIFSSSGFETILARLIVDLSPVPERAEAGTLEWQFQSCQRIMARWRDEGPDQWPSRERTREFLGMLPSERARRFLLNEEHFNEEKQREILRMLLVRTLMAQWQRAVPEHVPPNQFHEVLSSFKERDHQDLNWRDSAALQAAVMRALASESGPIGTFAKRYSAVHQMYRTIDPFSRDRRHRDRDRDDHDRRDRDHRDRERNDHRDGKDANHRDGDRGRDDHPDGPDDQKRAA